ncbi:hypothetical protein PRIPAC_84479 [Pristionchus pacificus]|uniref:CUB domain-containing protein n=1 Tax=Pristionchus pacificus TaxID=54126 RepID=A0A2A6CEL4_PRIPA|nr:hypothetical protein PRIPAC_84479 [Pristionchus pacificus]|eukprot:PDM76540.1 CUB domain-containing protein [Pristionchus pacificus]
MWRLLFLVTILQLAHCQSTCPKGYDLVRDGECRGHAKTATITLDLGSSIAVDTCAGVQPSSKPVIIHDDEHQDYWKAFAPENTSEGFLILGIVCDKKSGRYMWADGTRIDYKPSLVGWNPGGRGSPVSADFYCTYQIAPSPPGADGCDNFADDEDDGVCYQVSPATENWQDAHMTCKKLGAELASIHNQQENNFIRRLAVSKGAVNGVFLGASVQQDGSFAWIDGSKMDYENYYPGFPKKNFGDCIGMDSSTSAGQWMNVDCNSQLPVACIRQQGSTEGPVCTGDDYAEGTIITSPGFPNTASTECDWFLTVEPDKKVQMEIILLEANSCCDTLILYDGYLGGSVIEKLSGSIQNQTYTTKTSNIMRVSWQPNGGVNVRGLAVNHLSCCVIFIQGTSTLN